MVVLSAAICTKGGKTLLARQFVEMTRIRIEGLLAAFPKLIGTENKQHTFVETESVRYVYQPLDNFYLLLITNRASNIVEDLDTLRMLSKVVPSITGTAGNLTEEKVSEKVFELIFSFDEVVTQGGHREPVSLAQIRSNLDMDSHEEKLANMIKASKMESARDQAAAAAKMISVRNRDKVSSLSSESSSFNSNNNTSSNPSSSVSGISSGAGSSGNTSSSPLVPPSRGVKGMALGGTKKGLEEALIKEDKLRPLPSSSSTATSSNTSSVVASTSSGVPVVLTVTEKVTARLSAEGQVESAEVRGTLSLTAATEEVSACTISLSIPQDKKHLFLFTTHPKLNKTLFESEEVLSLKEQGKGFPAGRPVGLLKWTSTLSPEEVAPVRVNCWPEEEGRGTTSVSIEFSSNLTLIRDLHEVSLRIPLGTSSSPSVHTSEGVVKHLRETQELLWSMDLVDRDHFSSAQLDFSIAQRDTKAFYPIAVSFSSLSLFSSIEVRDVVSGQGTKIPFSFSKSLSAEDYTVG